MPTDIFLVVLLTKWKETACLSDARREGLVQLGNSILKTALLYWPLGNDTAEIKLRSTSGVWFLGMILKPLFGVVALSILSVNLNCRNFKQVLSESVRYLSIAIVQRFVN
jgi:hypothetical protein